MKAKNFSSLILPWLFCCTLILVTTACEAQSSVEPRAWLDVPLDGSSVPVGTPIQVVAHVYASEGVAEVLLSVNGTAYRRSPAASSETFTKLTQEWTPQQEGDYILQITTFSKNGASSNPASAHVRAIGKATRTPIPIASTMPTPVVTGTPTRGSLADLELVSVESFVSLTKGDAQFCDIRVTYRNAGAIPIPNDYTIQAFLDGRPHTAITRGRGFGVGGTSEAIIPYQFTGTAYIGITLDSTNAVTESNEANNAFADAKTCGSASMAVTPSPTFVLPIITIVPTRTLTLTPTPVALAQINFRADQTTITRGQCTTLRWDVDNATSVYLDGNGVQGHGLQQVCPNNTATYTLRVTAPVGATDRNLTITVQVPANTSTPTRTPTPRDTQGPAAPNLISPKGAFTQCRTSVTLDWNAVTDPSGIKNYTVKWVRDDGQTGGTVTMGTQHTITLTCDNKSHTYTWSVQAEDNNGNRGATSSATFTNPAGLY
jgi:hypothetical protein